MKLKFHFLILLATVVFSPARAQKQNNIWAFGQRAGIDFNSGSPVALNTSITNSLGCASVSNHSGALLFYTNGDTVWNRNHIPMPNGTGLLTGDGTGLQDVAIVPFINDTTRFYIFQLTTRPYEDLAGSLYYSVVDMSLNGGMGDVAATLKNQLLWNATTQGGLGSGMATAAGTGCNTWLINHRAGGANNNNKFVVHEISQAGINTTAVVSQTGAFSGPYAYMTGMIKASPDGRKLANTTVTIYVNNNVPVDYAALEIQDFNPATGVVSNSVTLDSTADMFFNMLATGFSPGGTKLYGTTPLVPFVAPGGGGVYQFDLSLPTAAAIRASKTMVSTNALGSDITIGPDGKVYVGLGMVIPAPATSVDRIDAPDVAGTGCAYNPSAVALLPGTGVIGTFPNPVVYPVKDSIFNTYDTLICSGDRIRISAPGGFLRYYWQGQPATDTSFEITGSGTYRLSYENDCKWVTDTFHVLIRNLEAGLRDTALCSGQFPLELDAAAANPAGTQYTWQDGTTGPRYTVNTGGTYTVTMALSGCSGTGRIQVIEKPEPVFSLGADTLICSDRPLELRAPAAGAYLWQNGSTGRTFAVADSGLYWVSVTISGCTGSDSIRVSVADCDCKLFIPNAFSPNGDGLNDLFVPVVRCGTYEVAYQLSIYNRWGQRVFYSRDPGKSWDGTYNGHPADAGTYFFDMAYAPGQSAPSLSKKGDLLLIR